MHAFWHWLKVAMSVYTCCHSNVFLPQEIDPLELLGHESMRICPHNCLVAKKMWGEEEVNEFGLLRQKPMLTSTRNMWNGQENEL